MVGLGLGEVRGMAPGVAPFRARTVEGVAALLVSAGGAGPPALPPRSSPLAVHDLRRGGRRGADLELPAQARCYDPDRLQALAARVADDLRAVLEA
jgi:hypothetical protein